MKITYRKGVITRTSLTRLWSDFDGRMSFNSLDSLDITSSVSWSNPYTDLKIDEFVIFLKSKGVEIESVRKRESPTTGMIKFKRKP